MTKIWPIHSTERGLVCACSFRCEIVSLLERVMVVEVGKLVEIPSYLSCIPPPVQAEGSLDNVPQ